MTLSLLIYLVNAPFGYAFFVLLALTPTSDRDRRARRLLRVQQVAFRMMHGWMRLLSLQRFVRPPTAGVIPDGPCVIIANHPTLTDTTSIGATVDRVVMVVKPSIWRRWWIKPLLRNSAHIEGVAGNPFAVERVVESAVDRLARGYRLLIFPEGTRSPAGSLGSFGRAPFEIACRANVPVIPILVHCEPLWLSKENGLFRPPHPCPRLQLTVLPAREPARYGHDSRAFRSDMEAHYRDAIGAGRAGADEPTSARLESP